MFPLLSPLSLISVEQPSDRTLTLNCVSKMEVYAPNFDFSIEVEYDWIGLSSLQLTRARICTWMRYSKLVIFTLLPSFPFV